MASVLARPNGQKKTHKRGTRHAFHGLFDDCEWSQYKKKVLVFSTFEAEKCSRSLCNRHLCNLHPPPPPPAQNGQVAQTKKYTG